MESKTGAEVIFVVEGTAVNGIHFSNMKYNYVIPTIEYFSQKDLRLKKLPGSFEDTSVVYGLVIYHASDCRPNVSSYTYGPYTDPHKLLKLFGRIEFIGGRGESCANVAEGLATALECFNDLSSIREEGVTPKKHCVLLCSSQPYEVPAIESPNFVGYTLGHLAYNFKKLGINLSILSPCINPALIQLFEKSGGDLEMLHVRKYAKDPHHLILLSGYRLKDYKFNYGSTKRFFGIPTAAGTNAAEEHKTPHMSITDTPSTSQHTPMRLQNVEQALLCPTNTSENPSTSSYLDSRQMDSQSCSISTQHTSNIQISASSFPAASNLSQSAKRKISMQKEMCMEVSSSSQLCVDKMQDSVTMEPNSKKIRIYGGDESPSFQHQQFTQARFHGHNNGSVESSQELLQESGEIHKEKDNCSKWKGALEWRERLGNRSDLQKVTRQVTCELTPDTSNEHDLKIYTWPHKLLMQLIPVKLLERMDAACLKSSKRVSIDLEPCESLEALKTVLSSGYVGCIHFSTMQSPLSPPEMKILIVTYSRLKQVLGFVPNDQFNFYKRLRDAIQQSDSITEPKEDRRDSSENQNYSLNRKCPVWKGVLEWMRKTNGLKDTLHIPCKVMTDVNDMGDMKVNTWPQKLILQLFPKNLISEVGSDYLKNSKSVVLDLEPCESLESLKKHMSSGLAGSIFFSNNNQLEMKVALLIYSLVKHMFVVFIPCDQTSLIRRLKETIQQHQQSFLTPNRNLHAEQSPAPTSLGQTPTTSQKETESSVLINYQQSSLHRIAVPDENITLTLPSASIVKPGEATSSSYAYHSEVHETDSADGACNVEALEGDYTMQVMQECQSHIVSAQQLVEPCPSLSPVSVVHEQGDKSCGNESTEGRSTLTQKHILWRGIIEWTHKSKTSKEIHQTSCEVTSHTNELNTSGWPQKLVMQLMPKNVLTEIGNHYLKNSKYVIFDMKPCVSQEILTTYMKAEMIGCVHFPKLPPLFPCETNIILLIYSVANRVFVGLIPSDQSGFINRLRETLQSKRRASQNLEGSHPLNSLNGF